MMIRVLTIFLLLSFCINILNAQSERSLLRKGNKQYNNKEFAESEVSYLKALEADMTNEIAVFNLGDAMYSQDKFEEAANQFQLASDLLEDKKLKAAAFHNLGNSFLAQDKYEESIKAYKEALKLEPGDMDTKYNLAYANEMLRKQQQSGSDGDQDQEDEENKDQEQEQDKNDKNKEQGDQEQEQDQENQDQEGKNDQQEGEQKEKEQQQQKDQGSKPSEQNLSKEEAARILEALQNEEQKLQRKLMLQKNKSEKIKVEKDW